eukprot:302946_1
MEDAMKLTVHEKIDHRDQVGRAVFATVIEKKGSLLKIHYDGWSRIWDIWSDFSVELHRFAVAGSISLRPAHRLKSLKKGDYVDINPLLRHFGWKVGEIRRRLQGQVQVVYEYSNKNYLYWTHLDDMKEIAPFASKAVKGASVHRLPVWNEIDIVKAVLWDSDGKSVDWIASKLKRPEHDVRNKIKQILNLRKVRKQAQKVDEIKKKRKIKNKSGKRKLQNANDVNKPQLKKRKLNSKDKSKMSAKDVANWIGSLGNAYKQYVNPCIDNAIDGSLMDELNEDSLSDMVANKIHRKKIMLEWYKL